MCMFACATPTFKLLPFVHVCGGVLGVCACICVCGRPVNVPAAGFLASLPCR